MADPRSPLRLHWHPFSIVPRRVRIALREKAVAHEEVLVDVPRGEQHTAAFRRLNPFDQIPVLEHGDLVVCESIAILEYLEELFPRPRLLAADTALRARTRELMLWSGDYLTGPWKDWMAPAFAPGEPIDAAARRRAHDHFALHLDVLERRLSGGDWLVGDYSLADVCYAPLVTVFDRVGLGDLVDARPAVAAWVVRLNQRQPVRDTAPPPVRLSLPPAG